MNNSSNENINEKLLENKNIKFTIYLPNLKVIFKKIFCRC